MHVARRLLTVAAAAAVVAFVAAPAGTAASGWFSFKRTSNTDSRLVFKWAYDTNPTVYTSPTWRAGSGSSTVCGEIGRGWLPLGWYDVWGHWNHYDALIKGRVIWLQNKRCGDGTLRTELFIHSEETAANGQSCPTGGDDPYCWEGWFDYYSNGCIKLAYPNAGYANDIGSAHWYWHNRFGSTLHGDHANLPSKLYVHT